MLVLLAGLLLCTSSVFAQSTAIDPTKRCLYSQEEFSDPIYFLGNDPRVEQIVDEICKAAGMLKTFKVQGANIPTVAAIKDPSGDYLLYSLRYSRELLASNPDVLYAILAHGNRAFCPKTPLRWQLPPKRRVISG